MKFALPAAVRRRNQLLTAAYLLAATAVVIACLGSSDGAGFGTVPAAVRVGEGGVSVANTGSRSWTAVTVSLGLFQATQFRTFELPAGQAQSWPSGTARVPCLVLVTAHRPEGGLPDFWIGFAR